MTRTILGLGAILMAVAACADSQPTELRTAVRRNAKPLTALSGRRCRAVEGNITERITGANTAAGQITGDVSGDVSILITDLQQLPGGLVKFQAECTMVTSRGTLTTNDNAVLSAIDAPLYRVNNHLVVSGGTGSYAGATGNLHTHGTVNFVPGGLVDLQYSGELCDSESSER